ncbi:regulator of nonsense transcripts 3B-like [Eriocheir sinensis]|uniref:regulator of nonsense transcripts 3B-like n=1 Tax=Eriocheir sinensis TaxID=95602 RepID=UPI0021C924F2|nr:regulator of nonsense transcripts 3B-like [Eriocheir sinensis]XP_050716682.1 regulator of nonsense transcripts 3B-like [Eriocheir sinensis]
MTVKTVDGSKRDNPKPYCENASKRLAEVKHNIKAKKERTNGPPTKVVVRRLPPTMTEEEFLEAVTPLPEHDYFSFCPSDGSLGSINSFTRVYINFKSQGDIFIFRDKFDGYVFVDKKGNEYPAMVEFAPFQKVPRKGGSKKKDARCGTIDQDPDYLAFLESIENPETVTLQSLEVVLEEIQAHDRELKANNGYLKVKTPLLEYIEQKKAEKLRSKEEKREERRRKEFERKKAKEEEKRKKKEVKDQKDMKKKEDQKEDISGVKLQVLQPERVKEDGGGGRGDARPTRKERERERYEKEKQRRIEEDHQRREREKEKGKFTRKDKEREREERIRRQEEKFRMREEERIRHREEGREERGSHREGRDERMRYKEEARDERMRHRDEDREELNKNREERKEERVRYREEEGVQESHRAHKTEGVKSKRYSEGRKKEERDRRVKEERGKKKEEEQVASPETEEQQKGEPESREKGEPESKGEAEAAPERPVTHKKREKDPRVERRIRNKDRPAMALYRPGQSRLSSRIRNEREEGAETSSSSPSPVMLDAKKTTGSSKKSEGSNNQKTLDKDPHEATSSNNDNPSAPASYDGDDGQRDGDGDDDGKEAAPSSQ